MMQTDRQTDNTVVKLSQKIGKSVSAFKEAYRLGRLQTEWTDLPPLSTEAVLSDRQTAFFVQKYPALSDRIETGETGLRQADRVETDRQTELRQADRIETEYRQKLQTETDRIETELRQKYETELRDRDRQRQTELRQLETELRQKLQTEYAERERQTVQTVRTETAGQTDRLLESETEKQRLIADKVRSEVTLQITEAAKEAAEQKLADRQRELERAYKIKFGDLETQFETELSAALDKLKTDFETEIEAQKDKPFFEQKWFAVIVLLITMSIQMYEVALFAQNVLKFEDLLLPLFWGFAFQFGGLMMTIHIGNSADFRRSFLFWFSILSFIINLYVLIPGTEGIGQISGRVLFALMFPFIEFAYGKIYLKLK